MNVAEILKAAKAKISDPINWMQGYYARDINGDELLGNESGAVCFCGFGAIEAVTGIAHLGEGWPKAAENALHAAAGTNFPCFNDAHTHEEVLAVFDKAIELAEKESA
jgi:hypothetical protein